MIIATNSNLIGLSIDGSFSSLVGLTPLIFNMPVYSIGARVKCAVFGYFDHLKVLDTIIQISKQLQVHSIVAKLLLQLYQCS